MVYSHISFHFPTSNQSYVLFTVCMLFSFIACFLSPGWLCLGFFYCQSHWLSTIFDWQTVLATLWSRHQVMFNACVIRSSYRRWSNLRLCYMGIWRALMWQPSVHRDVGLSSLLIETQMSQIDLGVPFYLWQEVYGVGFLYVSMTSHWMGMYFRDAVRGVEHMWRRFVCIVRWSNTYGRLGASGAICASS